MNRKRRAFNIHRTPLRDAMEYWWVWIWIPLWMLLLIFETIRGFIMMYLELN